MLRKNEVQQLIARHHLRLQKLKERQAIQGINTDPAVLIEIEMIEAELADLEAELAAGPETRGPAHPAEPVPSDRPGQTYYINTGGGAYILGQVNTGGGDFAGRDQVKTTGPDADAIAQVFEAIYARIEARPATGPEDKADLKIDVQEIQAEIKKGEGVDEAFLSRRLRNIQRMAPDILEVVLAALTGPAAGLSAVTAKVTARIKTVGSG